MQETKLQKIQLDLSMEGEEKQSLQFDYDNQYDDLISYEVVTKKILQKFKFVASGKRNIRLSINNFYRHQTKLSIPIFHPKNWITIIGNMLERGITTIDVTVTREGELRIKRQREKKVPVEFDSDGSIESVQDENVKTAITVNKPSCQPYRGQAVVRCIFCHHSNKSKEGSRSAGLMYGPFKGKVFAHLMCLLWCSKVYIQDQTFNLCGVQQAVKYSKNLICSYCKQKGASFYCHSEGCKKRSHFKCATQKDWHFQWQTYQAYCPQQRNDPYELSSASNTRTATNRQRRIEEIKIEMGQQTE